ncbi:SAV_2336 N-terminal domain-related protein [Actinophytocola sp. KF-1]
MIDRLAQSITTALPELRGEQIADALWLAAKYSTATESSLVDSDTTGAEVSRAGSEEDETPADNPAVTSSGADLALTDEERPSTNPQAILVTEVGLRVPVATGPMPITVVALSQFRRVRRPGPPVVDVDATVEATADVGRLVVVSRPSEERGLDVAIVVDRTPVAMVWADAIDEFAATLRRTGAFRSVSRWWLDELVLRDSAGTVHGTDIIIDPAGRRLVLLLTDATAARWYEEQAWHVLNRWAKAMPTALVHLLPRSYWGYTATGEPTATVRSGRPAVPNSGAEVMPSWWGDDPDPTDVPVPIIALCQEDISRWADAVVSGNAWADAMWARPAETVSAPASELTPADRVRTFQSRASVGAQDLARVLASAPLLSLPLIRVLHEHLIPAPEPGQLAEIFVSGLLEKLTEGADAANLLLRFRPGVADLLYQGTTASQEWDVYEILTQHLERNASSGNAIRAVLPDPQGAATIDRGLVPFAAMSRGMAIRLGIAMPAEEIPPGDEAPAIPLRPISSRSVTVPVVRGTSGIVCVPDATPSVSATQIADIVVHELVFGLLDREDADAARAIEDGGVSVAWYADLFSPDDVHRMHAYFNDPDIRQAAQDRLSAMITDNVRVIVAHSFGAVVAYEALCANPEWPVRTLVTVSAPLGSPSVIDQLDPPPRRLKRRRDRWPENITSWIDVATRDETEAAGYDLRDLFGSKIQFQLVSGERPDDARWHLETRMAASAISKALRSNQTTAAVPTVRTSGGRRFLVSCVVDYSTSVLMELPWGGREAAEIVAFFRSLGYEHVPLAPTDQTKIRILEDLRRFVEDPERNPDDTMLFYLSGHAALSRERYFFLPADTVTDQIDTSGISADDLGRILFTRPSIDRQLLVIDTGAAGHAIRQLDRVARRVSNGPETAMIASTDGIQRAREPRFGSALIRAAQELTDDDFDIKELVHHVNQYLRQNSKQLAVAIDHGVTSSYTSAFFSRNRDDRNRAIEQIVNIERPAKVFIAYAHDSQAHKDDVRRLADLLRMNGVDAQIDQYAEEDRQDWTRWTYRQILESDFIIVVASPIMKAADDGTSPADKNPSVRSQMVLLRNHIQQETRRNILPVVLPGGTRDELPMFVFPHTATTYFVHDFTIEGIDELIRVIANQPGVNETDRITSTHGALWQFLRRWGITTQQQARTALNAIEREVDSFEDPRKPALYRPIRGVEHNQLWLVLHEGSTRPAADPDRTDDENTANKQRFVANSARAVREAVKHLEVEFGWFRQPEDLKHRDTQRHFGQLYDALRTVTRHEDIPPALRRAGLTIREYEVLRLLADGLGNREIADRLHLSHRTVEKHVSSLITKTGLPNRRALREYAVATADPVQ